MKITVKEDAVSGSVEIPKGDYWVALAAERGQFKLVAGGKEIAVPAIRRSMRAKAKRLTICFSSAGGAIWSLIASQPASGEWVAFFDLSKRDAVKED